MREDSNMENRDLEPAHRTTGPSRSLRERFVDLVSLTTAPVAPGDLLDMVDPLRAGGDWCGRVIKVVREADGAATLTIRPSRHWRGHKAGQFVQLGVEIDGVRHWRTFTISSAAADDAADFQVTVKAHNTGFVSRFLVSTIAPGTLLHLQPAAGDFVLPAGPSQGPLLLVTAGSGITPVMSMMRSHGAQLRDVVIVHSARTSDAVIFGAELRDLADRHGWTLIEWHSGSKGRLSVDDLVSLVPDWRERRTFACGPAGLLNAVESHWESAGLATSLHTERFQLVTDISDAGGQLTFTESGQVVESDGHQTIMDAGESAGVDMKPGCRMGVCFGCVAHLQRGAVRDVRNGEVLVNSGEGEIAFQPCVSVAAGDCEIKR